ncbi:MAG: S9 family peptidase [Novosphingobium sp.]
MSLTTPPIAAKKPHVETHHGIDVSDDYAWLRDPGYPVVTNPEVLAHLNAENVWFEQQMAPQKRQIDALFTEMRGRIKEADSSVPQKDGNFRYWIEFEQGAEYKKWWRQPIEGGPDQLILDEVALAAGLDYFRLGALAVSPSGRFMAYSTDQDGSERYTIRFRDLSGTLADWGGSEVPGTIGGVVWSADESAVLYSLCDENWRHRTILLHRIGSDPASDVTIYHEPDEGFSCAVVLGAQERWIIIQTGDHDSSEVRLIPAADPLAAPILVKARQPGIEYEVDLHGETLFIHTNDTHENFRLATAPLANPGAWTTLIEGSDEFYLTGFDLFRDFYVIDGRVRGLDRIEVRYYDDPARIEPISFPEASFSAGLGENSEWAMDTLRLSYESMVSPASVIDYDVAAQTFETLKVQEIPSGYDAALYTTRRLEIAARDGTLIPVSLVERKDRKPCGPLHLYGYGAYGIAIDPGFSTTRLSLVDRGFVYAIAHIRGGDDLGRAWYKAGKLEQRCNTFTDFVDVAKGLIGLGLTQAGRISISGGSAGGELMGAVINSDPDLWGAVAAHVPFVDVLATMLDPTLPLTPGEWPEWGNPIEDKAAFDLIRSYSPYDQVSAQAYPPLLVTAGLNDPRVTYWEPAKWVAKLRELKTDQNELLFKTNMGAGHGGKSGRFEGLKETAEEFAFILWQLGVEE